MRTLLAAGGLALAGLLSPDVSLAQMPKELTFGIIATDSSSALKALWQPLLADMEKEVGVKVNAMYATDYAGVVEAMRFNKVQVAWHGNASAIPAVDRASGEIFVKQLNRDGSEGYYSVLLVHRDSPIQSFEDILKSPGTYTFGNGDPNSASGFLIPSYYAWAKHNIDVRKHFKNVVSANHAANLLAVANKHVDVATNNNVDILRMQRTNPDKAALVRVVWQSPLIPSDPILWRSDLPGELKTKLKAFFVNYGKDDREKAILTPLEYSGFKESSNAQLIPIRQIQLFRDKLKIEQDTALSDAEKRTRTDETDRRLAELAKLGS